MHRVRRMMIGWIVAAGVLWLPAGCTWMWLEPVDASVESSPEDAQVTLVRVGDRTVVEIRSPSGIGRSRITFAGELPPGPVEFRLHLAGLEHFSLAYGDTEISLSVATGAPAPIVTARSAGVAETAVDVDSPFWMEVQVPETDGANPVFRIDAPADLSAQRPRVLEIRWIDFYR